MSIQHQQPQQQQQQQDLKTRRYTLYLVCILLVGALTHNVDDCKGE